MKVIAVLCILLIAGCSIGMPEEEGETGDGKFGIWCVDGVEYLHLEMQPYKGMMAPHFKTDGTLYTCGRY